MAKDGSTNDGPELSLRVGLEFSRSAYPTTPRDALVFLLTNESSRALNVLKRHTPLEGFRSDMFEVRRGGKPVPYVGRLYKRAPPTAEDYVTIQPGRTLRQAVDFFDAYDVAERGNYNVQYRTRLLHAGTAAPAALAKSYAAGGRQLPVTVRANTALFALTRPKKSKLAGIILAASKKKPKKHARKARKVAFRGCSEERNAALQAALDAAVQMANAARDAIDGAPSWARPNARRYREWFGGYKESRYGHVANHFDKIADTLANKDIRFICDGTASDCAPGDYAYSNIVLPYHIHLCGAFWAAALTGTDSRAGTLVHEISHFLQVAGTGDHANGQADCRALAIDSPDDAVGNANSHEYFAENAPVLGMDPAPGDSLRITDGWHGMPGGFSGGFDAVLNGGRPYAGKCYFFKGDSYIRYDWGNDSADSGYPKNIAANWYNMPGSFSRDFDAAVNGQGDFSGKCYFFKGDSYVRYDWNADRADSGYPKSIAANWHNMPSGFTSDFDAIINGGGQFAGKCYFFKGDSYVRYDWNADSADPGYPRRIADNWHCLPAGFTASFGDAVEGDRQFSDKGYFFKGDLYVRYNWDRDCVEL